MSEWRPIGTHDGSSECVLVWGEIADSSETFLRWHPCGQAGIACRSNSSSGLSPWCGESAGYHDEYYWWKPTHWMPLPGPPPVHASDCAVHNEPAMPNGPCDCGADTSDRRRNPGMEESS